MSRSLTVFTFHNQTILPSNGNEYFTSEGDEITFEIFGTATISEVIFEGKCHENGNYYAISCVKLDDLSMATSTTSINQLWQVSVSSLSSFRVRVVSITNGYISVIGKVSG